MSGLDDMTVRYTAKELFAQINAKLDGIVLGMEAKADHAALVLLEARVDALETSDTKRVASSGTVKGILAVLLAIFLVLLPIAAHYVQ